MRQSGPAKRTWLTRPPPSAHLAGVGAELAVTPAGAPGKPSTAIRCRTPGGGHHAGNLPGELLPDGVNEFCRPVADGELRWPLVGRGEQF